MNSPPSRTSPRRCFSCGRSGPYCAAGLKRGIRGTPIESRGTPSQHEIAQPDDDQARDRVLDIAERVMEALPVLPHCPADTGEHEAPQRRAEKREHRVAAERMLEHAGRDGHERADDGGYPAEEHRLSSPPVEPPLGALESLRGKVEPLAVTLDERPAAVVADRPAGDRAQGVADRPRGHHDGVRLPPRLHLTAEDDDVLPDERTGRECPGVEHHELARRREDRVHEHEQEDGVDAVVADERCQRIGDRLRDRGDEHGVGRGQRAALSERVRRTENFDVRETVPAELLAVMRATYVPEWTEAPLFERPSQDTVAVPASSATAGSALRTTVPVRVSMRDVTDAALVRVNSATAFARRRGTESAGG